jgi:carboxyl-terminal processing protease
MKHLMPCARLVALAALLQTPAVPAAELQPDPQQGRVAKMLAITLPLRHLSRDPMNDHVATNALDIFLSSLDFERVYFLQSDIDSFRTLQADLDDQIRAGDLAFAFRVYNVFKTRVANRVAFVQDLLEQGFDVTQDEEYRWKRKDASWAADEEAWNDLWRRKIKNEYVARLVAAQVGEEDLPLAAAGGADVTETTSEPEVVVTPATNAAATTVASTNAVAAEVKEPPEQQIRKNYERFLTIMQDNDATWLNERYLNAFTHAYDPHSDYMSPQGTEDFEIGMKLSLQGIGALLSSEDGAAKVERLIPGGPAERDGRLKPKDKIIAVAQGDKPAVDVLHWPLQKTVRLIRGEKGSKVVLTVIPAADSSGSTVTHIDLIRDEVKLEEQAAKSELKTVLGADGLERKLGVITLPEFYADLKGGNGEEARRSSRDVQRLLGELRDQGAEGIVLDLRSNGGGSLADAVEMTGLFIESGPVVQVKDQRRVHTLSDPNPDVQYKGPVVVLVNRLSASASEILAGALQDYGRAIIIGDSKTHGKGTVQTLTSLNAANTNMGSLKVTTASFYRIAGGSTQLRGVEPDITIPSPFDAMDIGEEQLPHAMGWSQVDAAFYDRDPSLDALRPELKLRSENRRGGDARFNTYTNLLARLAERQRSTTVSLNLEKRLQLARSEKELQKELEQSNLAEEQDDKKKKLDLVLIESLQVLCDWISLREDPKAIGAAARPAGPS